MSSRYTVFTLLFTLLLTLSHLTGASFESMETKDATGEKIEFPGDLTGSTPIILALILGDSRESGEAQIETMLAWQDSLSSDSAIPAATRIYHMPIIEGLPFFLKGIVRDGMRESYRGAVSDSNIAVLFLKDMKAFIEDAGIPFSYEPTLVILESNGNVRTYVKGAPDERNLSKIREALSS
ncbi:MAG: hypothetical protein JXK93_10910 [Sphaerochaetaceae bacterium]|nr:hypothetical protein [Sphaerochaetaceae bacterium]